MNSGMKHRVIITTFVFGLALGPAIAAQPKRGSDTSIGLLTNRIWIEASPTNGMPGVMKTFLSDGTLLQDSCWEAYVLSEWQASGPTKITWSENGMQISADVISISTVELVLEIGVGKAKEQHIYLAAKTPYLCPEMPKS